LLDEYQLDAAETVFIDDMSENLAAAESIGIQTIQFTSSAQCKQDLLQKHSISWKRTKSGLSNDRNT
jgi:FMN phosphatase YigB (HAD superfamily)